MEDLKDLQDGYMECALDRLNALKDHAIKVGAARAHIQEYKNKIQTAKSMEMALYYTEQANSWTSIKMWYENFIKNDLKLAMEFVR